MSHDNTYDSDEHYYALGYDVECDPYVYDNGVLINIFGIKNTADLNKIEKSFTVLTVRELFKNPSFTFPATTQLYQGLHKSIFLNIYPWAGELRTVDICKGDTIFCHHGNIEAELNKIFDEINNLYFNLKSMPLDDLSAFVADLLGRLNHIHPFREGNGRTQRAFISGLLNIIDSQFKYHIDWEIISNDSMTKACIDFNSNNAKSMYKLIKLNIIKLTK